MKLGLVSLNYYKQNTTERARSAGNKTEIQNLDFAAFTEARSEKMDAGLVSGLAPSMTYVDGGESPQAFNAKRWVHESTQVKKLTDGKDGITPDLFAVIGVYHNKRNPRKRVAFISTHLVPLTLHGKKRSHFSDIRWPMWHKHWLSIKALVRELQAQGLTVFVAGDFNNLLAGRKIIKQIDPKAKWVIRKGLDWIFVIEGATKVARWGVTSSFSSGSDHRAYTRVITLR